MQYRSGVVGPAFRAAFPRTIPILAGYGFLGITYGILMKVSGFNFLYPMLISLTVYGGSLEYMMVSMMLAPYAPVQVLIMTLMIQARHIFYSISMLDKYKDTGWKKIYLIFGMSDETFSINCTAYIPTGIDKGWFYFFVTLLNHFYWIASSAIGGLLGSLITFDTKGLDFVMTAMFVVIFLEQWAKEKHHASEWIGLVSSVACLLIFGADNFLVPTMICILVLLAAFKKPIEKRTVSD